MYFYTDIIIYFVRSCNKYSRILYMNNFLLTFIKKKQNNRKFCMPKNNKKSYILSYNKNDNINI